MFTWALSASDVQILTPEELGARSFVPSTRQKALRDYGDMDNMDRSLIKLA